ncbi:MAG: DUF4412 domain-containing protein [Lewinellaceae bacterium]|nr:DUF4412 domain-containing protein [Lewinellaceae bacterium]
MKNFILTCLILSFSFPAFSQSSGFEGEIIYTLKYQDRTGQMTDAQAIQFLGTKQKYLIKGNQYRSEMDGLVQATQIYTGHDTLYNLMKGVNAILFIDALRNPDSLLSYVIKPVQEKIAGYTCDLLEIKSKEGLIQYWYSPEFKVNPADYSRHEYGFWKVSLSLTKGALPLKMVVDARNQYMETVAISVLRKSIEDAAFKLPKGLPLMPNPE